MVLNAGSLTAREAERWQSARVVIEFNTVWMC